MIITKLQGGLANQMFQWAYGRYLSRKYQITLYLDLNFYLDQRGCTPRNFSLNKFPNLRYNILPPDLKVNVKRISDSFTFSDFVYDDKINYYLDGYWQSEKYFKDIKDTIKEDLSPDYSTMDKLLKYPFIDSNTVSMHIRRTDYLTSNGYHPIQTLEYYKKGLELIGNYDYVFIFSDDINWCRDNLKFRNMIFMENNTDVQDLWLMSMCKNNIIANSSFSWWAAWLNNNKDKKVIAPNNWFGKNVNINESDIIPNDWIRI